MAGPKAWLRHLSALVMAGAVAAACGGTDFSAGDDPVAGAGGEAGDGAAGTRTSGGAGGSSAGSGGTGIAGTAGTSGSGSTTLCQNARDCDDANPCTVDFCNESGFCEHPPLCGGDEPRCCDGECGQCCRDEDCFPLSDCMEARCYQGFCTNTPGQCEDPGQVCGPEGCVPRPPCDGPADCDDGNPCTTESCVEELCEYQACEQGSVCCADGCAACCSDSQCADSDPCTIDSCDEGTCSNLPRCEPGELCCPSADNTSASCGECCEASTCDDDMVDCTVKTCRSGVCGNAPDDSLCGDDEICDPDLGGCTGGGECEGAGDCGNPGACKAVDCLDGQCHYESVTCAEGTQCCPEGPLIGDCYECCSNADCQAGADVGRPNCCQDDGQCHECCSDLDCQNGVAGAVPDGARAAIPIPIPCTAAVCDQNTRTCVQVSNCPTGERCCSDGFCSQPGQLCPAVE